MVYLVRENYLRNIQVHSQTDWNNARKQKYLSKKIKKPIFAQSSNNNDENGKDTHEYKKNFRKYIDLSICPPHFGSGHIGIHDTAHFSTSVDNNCNSSSIGEETITPQGVL